MLHAHPIFDEAQVLLVTEERETVSAVAHALGTNGEFGNRRVCRSLQQLAIRLETGRTPAVLVDIDREPKRTLADLEPIINRFPETRFLVLSSTRVDDLMLGAMQIGARHFLVKDQLLGDLPDVLARIIPTAAARKKIAGPIVTVLSASGGCGATTLAANLGHEIHLLSGEPAMLVDLDCFYGGVATYLGLDGQYGVADVLGHPAAIDADLIQTTSVPCGKGVRALLSPASTNFRAAGPLAPERLPEMVEAVAASSACTVIDAPRLGPVIEATLANMSRATLLVFQLCVKDVRVARIMRSSLIDAGVAAERILMIANRYRKRHSMVGIQDAATVFGTRVESLPNDYKPASLAMNFGQPLAEASPRSVLRRDIARLAATIRKDFLMSN